MNEAVEIEAMEARLTQSLEATTGDVAIAVSGGIDSLTLATFAHRWSATRSTMFHAVSPAVPGDATARVERLALAEGWRLTVVDAGEFDDADYVANPVNRCFFCKTNLYGSIGRHTSAQMMSGANLNDLGEYRPGLDAARNKDVRHPYLESQIDKAGVRTLARSLGLGSLSELPAAPCLSSRVETGIAIQPAMLRAIHAVERDLAQDFPRGTVRCRVRAAGIVVELDPDTLAAVRGPREAGVRSRVAEFFADPAAADRMTFAPYRNGSAFLHGVG